jgi:hypothetical protein
VEALQVVGKDPNAGLFLGAFIFTCLVTVLAVVSLCYLKRNPRLDRRPEPISDVEQKLIDDGWTPGPTFR